MLNSTEYNKLLEENIKLKERISNIVSENVELQNALFTEQLNEDETKNYINRLKKENYELQNTLIKQQMVNFDKDKQITDLKTKLLDSSVKEQRLLKILNETSDYT